MRVSILILEPPGHDFADLRRAFRREADPAWEVAIVSEVGELERSLRERGHALAIVPEEAALELVPKLRATCPDLPVVATAAAGGVEGAAQAIRAGATDFLVRGERLEERIATLLGKLHGLFEVIDRNRMLDEQNAELRDKLQTRFSIVGESAPMRALIDQVRRIADVPRPLLIIGERGTGKEQIAKAIHFSSQRANDPMITVNCAAFSDSLLESELFGHEKGAFTGAQSQSRGKFELADGGTLFLDEIAHMSPAFQRKILRVVEYGTYARVGGTVELSTNARIIAATNSDLQEKIASGDFLPDLYDRLSFEVLRVPALRERNGDVRILAHHFLEQFTLEIPALRGKQLSRAALDALASYSFPGNVRELKNIIERAAYHDVTNEITPEDIGLLDAGQIEVGTGGFSERVRAYSERLISNALRDANGNQAEAARRLGLSYHQFRYHHRKQIGR